jgi:hypothetical protein
MVKEIPQDEWSRFRSEHKETRFMVQDPDDDDYSYEVNCIPIGDDEKGEDEGNEDLDADF